MTKPVFRVEVLPSRRVVCCEHIPPQLPEEQTGENKLGGGGFGGAKNSVLKIETITSVFDLNATFAVSVF